MNDLDFILQKTKALKEARDAASQGEWKADGGNGISVPYKIAMRKQICEFGISWIDPWAPHDAYFVCLAANESTRFADALEVLAKALEDYADMGGFVAEEALAQAAEILKGGE